MLVTQSVEDLKAVIDAIGAPVFVIDVLPDGAFRYAGLNQRQEEATGLCHDDFVGRSPQQVLPPEMAREVTRKYTACVARRAPYELVVSRVFRTLGLASDPVRRPPVLSAGSC